MAGDRDTLQAEVQAWEEHEHRSGGLWKQREEIGNTYRDTVATRVRRPVGANMTGQYRRRTGNNQERLNVTDRTPFQQLTSKIINHTRAVPPDQPAPPLYLTLTQARVWAKERRLADPHGTPVEELPEMDLKLWWKDNPQQSEGAKLLLEVEPSAAPDRHTALNHDAALLCGYFEYDGCWCRRGGDGNVYRVAEAHAWQPTQNYDQAYTVVQHLYLSWSAGVSRQYWRKLGGRVATRCGVMAMGAEDLATFSHAATPEEMTAMAVGLMRRNSPAE